MKADKLWKENDSFFRRFANADLSAKLRYHMSGVCRFRIFLTKSRFMQNKNVQKRTIYLTGAM